MTENKEVSFLPYHAINEFMTAEYRLNVIRGTLDVLPSLPDNVSGRLNQFIKKTVNIPGFRNSLKAPTSLKVKPMVESFEKNPGFVAALLAAWAEGHLELRQNVYDLLLARGWDILPLDADRSKLPGFMTIWPNGENFEVLNAAYIERYPDHEQNQDNVSLMIVWMSGRLPYQFSDAETEKPGEND